LGGAQVCRPEELPGGGGGGFGSGGAPGGAHSGFGMLATHRRPLPPRLSFISR